MHSLASITYGDIISLYSSMMSEPILERAMACTRGMGTAFLPLCSRTPDRWLGLSPRHKDIVPEETG